MCSFRVCLLFVYCCVFEDLLSSLTLNQSECEFKSCLVYTITEQTEHSHTRFSSSEAFTKSRDSNLICNMLLVVNTHATHQRMSAEFSAARLNHVQSLSLPTRKLRAVRFAYSHLFSIYYAVRVQVLRSVTVHLIF